MRSRRGLTLIEIVISIGLLVAFFGAIYLVYYSILDVILNTELRNAASAIVNRELEVVRNVPFEQVGTIGGVPSGIFLQLKTVTSSVVGGTFEVRTTVRSVDDPFDGTLGGSPNDTTPSDYKMVEFEIRCPTCLRFAPLVFTATVAPKNLESTSNDGSLFVNVFDANAVPVQGAVVRVVNASATPPIDLTDTTNANGVLQLVGVPTGTQSYYVTVTKSGYSSSQNYPPGGVGNPNPLNPYATVAPQTLTQTSFAIDRVSTLLVHTRNNTCGVVPSQNFSLQGAKLIGTGPDVLKFSTSATTDSGGMKQFNAIEWDTYSATLETSSSHLAGMVPLSPFVVNPSSTVDFSLILTTSSPDALLVTVRSAASTGPLSDATVHLSKAGYAATSTTGRALITHTDWSGGDYTAGSDIDVSNPAGTIKLLSQGGEYPTSTPGWLTSLTLDLGGATTTLHTLTWNPVSQPGGTSLTFQIASNNDNATWSYVGPDGTPGSYYATSGQAIASVHNNNRYVRYKAYLNTTDESATPALNDLTIAFTGVCVPLGQVLFSNLSSGTYSLDVGATGYIAATSSVAVSGAWQETVVTLNPIP